MQMTWHLGATMVIHEFAVFPKSIRKQAYMLTYENSSLLHSVLQVEQAREQQSFACVTEFPSHSLHISSMINVSCLTDLL
jgi:hypothetical protein